MREVDLDDMIVDPPIIQRVSRTMALVYRVIPFEFRGDTLFVAHAVAVETAAR